MEKKNPRKTLAVQFFFCSFFFLFCRMTKTSSSSPFPDLTFSQSPSSSPLSHLHQSPSHANLRRVLLGVLFGCLTGAFASIVFLFFIRLFLHFANRTPILKGPVTFYPKISSKSLKVLFSGNNPESPQMIGSSRSGKFFKVPLNSELTVAVKVLETNFSTVSPGTSSSSWKRKVQRELELLAKVGHRNVMSLRAYVRDHDQFSLVYDFIPNGSLEDAMKRVRMNQLRLGWEQRHRIAVGMVKGLKYLHFEFVPRILHYNLKPTNVLLDEDFDTKLGDCGLARLVMAGVETSISCYVAPECFQSCRYTDKSDIYSFGMILSMLLTGRDPRDPFFMEEAGRGGLVPWLRHLQQIGEAREALDPGILGEGEEGEEEMLMAIRIALVCLSDLPADRPSSDELEAMLTQLHSF